MGRRRPGDVMTLPHRNGPGVGLVAERRDLARAVEHIGHLQTALLFGAVATAARLQRESSPMGVYVDLLEAHVDLEERGADKARRRVGRLQTALLFGAIHTAAMLTLAEDRIDVGACFDLTDALLQVSEDYAGGASSWSGLAVALAEPDVPMAEQRGRSWWLQGGDS